MSAALEVTAFDADGTARPRAVKLPADPFDGLVHESAMHQAVKVFMANQRQGTAQTKTRGYVSGGNQKPWRQKGTGRARQGSTRSPLWPGGGTMFGPHPREYRQAIPKKLRQLAKRSALNARAQEQALTVIAPLAFEEPKTKRMAELIRNMGLDGHKVLVLTSELKSNVVLSARNIPDVDVMRYSDVSTYDILHADAIVIEEPALGTLESGGEVKHEPKPKKRRAGGQADSRTEGEATKAPAKRKGKAVRPSARPPVRPAKAAKSAPKAKAAAKVGKAKAKAKQPAAKKPGKKKD